MILVYNYQTISLTPNPALQQHFKGPSAVSPYYQHSWNCPIKVPGLNCYTIIFAYRVCVCVTVTCLFKAQLRFVSFIHHFNHDGSATMCLFLLKTHKGPGAFVLRSCVLNKDSS